MSRRAFVQLDNAFRVLLNDASWLKILLHVGRIMPDDPSSEIQPRRRSTGNLDARARFSAALGEAGS